MYGNSLESRSYLLDAERLLRIRGLNKRRVSPKCRLLHHFYTYTRIIGEATYMLRNYKLPEESQAMSSCNGSNQYPTENRLGVSSPMWVPPGHNPRLDDFLGLETLTGAKDYTHGDTDAPIDYIKGGLGRTFLQLYGVSEAWLSFVSQTTRMANILDKLIIYADQDFYDGKIRDAIEKRKDKLENATWSFVASSAMECDAESSSLTPHQNMVRALNRALNILLSQDQTRQLLDSAGTGQ